MPKFDGTGPQGIGPMSGRGFGPCRLGMGWRYCCGNRSLGKYFGWKQPQTKEKKLKALINYQEALQEELEDVKKEIAKVEKEQ